MRRAWQSLRGRVVLGMLGVALVPTLVLSWANYRATRASLQTAAEAQVHAAAVRAAAEVDAFHDRTLDYLRTLARLEAVEQYIDASPAERAVRRQAMRRLLLSVRLLDQVNLRAVALVDPDGRLLLDDGGHSTQGHWVLDEVDEARSTGLPAMSRVTAHLPDGVFLEGAAPILSGDRLTGFLVLRYDAALLQAMLERQRVFDRGALLSWINDELHIRLAGESPTVPLLTSSQKLAPAVRDSLAARGLLLLTPPSVQMTRHVGRPAMLADSTAIVSVTETYVDSTRELIGAAAPMRSRPWRVYAATPAAIALAPAHALLLQAAGVGLALSLVVVLLALGIGRRLTAPIAELADQARRIADGDYSARVTVRSSNEMRELGEAFNHLAERVGSLVSALAERSHELELDLQERARLEHELTDARRLESVGRLAGGVAHDFNNLLTVVLANLSLLEESLPADTPAAGELKAAYEAAARGADLTRQLLAYSRRGNVAARTIDLAAGVRKLEPLLSPLVGDTVRLTIDTAPGVLAVVMDPSQADQVVMNLATNARDAMPSGGTLRIGVRAVTTTSEILGLPPGHYIELSVQDSGQGMSADTVARAFEPFFTTKAVGRGTGLGLATVYGIVTRAGGSVHIESLPGHGTTFVVRLPVAIDALSMDERPPVPARTPAGQRELLILAEDDAAVRTATARQLRALGYEVVEAEDGAAAQALVERHVGDVRLVVSDVLMPRMDGVALRHLLRAQYPDLPVLLLSGNPPDEVSSLQWSGEFLAKPYSVSDLATRVRDLLDQPPASA